MFRKEHCKHLQKQNRNDTPQVDLLNYKSRLNLPIDNYKSQICHLVENNEVVLIAAETGSGKSTQIPVYLLEQNPSSHCSILVTEPRRVAAITVSQRVSLELQKRHGTIIGHRVRFDDNTNECTKIIYATDGMILREAMVDPYLKKYKIIILDEAHERSLQTDILLSLTKRALIKRRSSKYPLKVVVMSATLDIDIFMSFFPNCEKMQVTGRVHPVQVMYTKEQQEDFINASLWTALQIHYYENEGDILIFLPGQEDIEDLMILLSAQFNSNDSFPQNLESISSRRSSDVVESMKGMEYSLSNSFKPNVVKGVMICPLYAALPTSVQIQVFQPKPHNCHRKIILATNIAETSITLQHIRYVIDCGKCKVREYNSSTGMERLTVTRISKSQCIQRTGRAGRISSGICFRLYTEDQYDCFDERMIPEISRCNLSQIVLQLKNMGIDNINDLEFVTSPDIQQWNNALKQLQLFGAIDNSWNLTNYGTKMAKLPLDPVFAHWLLQSTIYNCTKEVLTAVAMLSTESIFFRPSDHNATNADIAHRRFKIYEGDIPTYISVYNAWINEAIYIPRWSRSDDIKNHKERKHLRKALVKRINNINNQEQVVIKHGEWCTKNYVNGRALSCAHDIRNQLESICCREVAKNGWTMDVTSSCQSFVDDQYEKEYLLFLKCISSGLFLNSASRIVRMKEIKRQQRLSTNTNRGKYRTRRGGNEVSIHPTSSLFGRNPPPKCVVYTEMLVTTRAYIKGVTQCKEEWLNEFEDKETK